MSKGKRRLKKEVKFAIGFVVFFVVVIGVLLIHRSFNKWDFVSNIDDIVLTIDDTNISLRELSYYIMQVERTGQTYAKAYDADNPKRYWNLYMNNEMTESGYVTDLARKSAMDFCIRDNIYYKEAVAAGFELEPEERDDVIYDARIAYETMTMQERKMTCLTNEDFELIMLKEALAHKYIAALCLEDEDGALDAIVLKYDVGGTYYEDLKQNYEITIDENAWNRVKVGTITINYN